MRYVVQKVTSTSETRFVRVALVLPTEFAYARGVLSGIIAATRERNMYAGAPATIAVDRRQGGGGGGGRAALPWLFRVYRGIYGHSTKYLARWFDDWKPDGIICQIYDDRLAKVYRDTGKPVVELFESRATSEFPRILPDDVATGEVAARHFLERGFRHFGFFGAPWMLWSRERELGFLNEIKRAFRSLVVASSSSTAAAPASPKQRSRDDSDEPTFSSYGSFGGDSSGAFHRSHQRRAAAMAEWLASLPRPVAVFVANDLWGFEVLQASREQGMRIPDEIALLGVDNEELLCEIAHPPLSSIRMGAEQIGHVAVSLLEVLLKGKKPWKRIPRIGPLEVVTRQSSDVLAVQDPDIAAALRHIRQHAPEGLSVKQMLDAVAVNRRTLERRFVSVLGYTPLEEIHRVRLQRAKTLLQTDLPIYEVAVRSGFTTPEYMATSFLRATGVTPTAYRRQFAPRTRWQHLPPV
jgi:LacI family transcriptional regulator